MWFESCRSQTVWSVDDLGWISIAILYIFQGWKKWYFVHTLPENCIKIIQSRKWLPGLPQDLMIMTDFCTCNAVFVCTCNAVFEVKGVNWFADVSLSVDLLIV